MGNRKSQGKADKIRLSNNRREYKTLALKLPNLIVSLHFSKNIPQAFSTMEGKKGKNSKIITY